MLEPAARALANKGRRYPAELLSDAEVRALLRPGYVVVPPSQHAAGCRYRWNTRHAPAPLPSWLAELLAPTERTPAPARPSMRPAASDRRSRYLEAALHAELGDVASAQPGTRNDTLNRAAFRLAQLAASGHGDADELPELLLQAAVTAGLTEAEARATINSGLEARAPAAAPHTRSACKLGSPRHYNQNHRRPPSRPPSPGATAGLMLGVIGAIDSRHDQLVALVEEA